MIEVPKALWAGFRHSSVPLVGAFAFLVVWEIACRLFSIRPILLPSPLAILRELVASR